MKKQKTERQLIIEAYQAQDACNLSGVVHSFSRAMTALREIYLDEGTEFFNTHTISILYASKIQSLALAGSCPVQAEVAAFERGRICLQETQR